MDGTEGDGTEAEYDSRGRVGPAGGKALKNVGPKIHHLSTVEERYLSVLEH
jgi:hypothetical protein